MPRDLDFRRRPDRPLTSPAVVERPNRRRRRQPPVIITSLLIFGLITVVAGLISPIQIPSKPENPSAPSINSTAVSAAENDPQTRSENPPFGSPPTAVVAPIQIYNAGAGEEAVAAAIAKLAAEQLPVKNLGRSQFDFDQSFIWYQPEQEPRAQEIAAKLGRQFTLKKSQIAGGFEILIYLGKD